ncbi:VOC family protein [Enterococcus pallens]|uniref:VOC domain-containing protein n=1 Tax=Enterococcus pallens ATCC BAA-351 TaxID=1158607 RepID=R2Q4H3_9ENTE|nr:VOC family protein [Enterococcus pallens]EOH90228.1 hypothetical protein UAU_04057 [Enterococcus pallens ATCC BAA-351]EOU15166.1 hypothetical protein I588_04098 [Enterococcus pallens ATCC BAA-351]OJG79102.1 hypothetical protein RV10_GL000935 [Enterococcus pallens]
MTYRFHHLHITVEDIAVSERFYDQLFTILGWDITHKYKGDLPHMDMSVVEYMHEDLDFAICSPKTELKNQHIDVRTPKAIQHFAFAAESKQAIDDFYEELSQLDVTILHNEARYYDKIAPNYYAVFFEDPNGIRLEVFYYEEG